MHSAETVSVKEITHYSHSPLVSRGNILKRTRYHQDRPQDSQLWQEPPFLMVEGNLKPFMSTATHSLPSPTVPSPTVQE